MTDGAFDIRWTGVDDIPRKLAFEPVDGGHLRIEYRMLAGTWIETGREPVEEVSIECADGVIAGL